MKALILNSGRGVRMGSLTEFTCKCLVEVANDATILDAQLKLLIETGLTDICITTGAFAEKLQAHIAARYSDLNITFVHNDKFEQTNYIYSIYLAKDMLQDDILLLHGDLVFERSVLHNALDSPNSIMVTDTTLPLPKKDFKAVVQDGRVRRVGVHEFCAQSRYAQPMYKLCKADWLLWLQEIERFCLAGNTSVYAENAFNEISHATNVLPLEIGGRACFEIDNADDLVYGQDMYRKLSDNRLL
ncbi:MAG: sugar phosphate nucleotidyltransferase [Oscillospiraceae bacterium]|nr:sugar phosphate nucleotidyltransferase [Oscillospiraceae bacterium]